MSTENPFGGFEKVYRNETGYKMNGNALLEFVLLDFVIDYDVLEDGTVEVTTKRYGATRFTPVN